LGKRVAVTDEDPIGIRTLAAIAEPQKTGISYRRKPVSSVVYPEESSSTGA
jgi:hypothetical protein